MKGAMSGPHTGRFWLPLLAVAWLESCGAMTIEPATPDEPTVAPKPAPRLMRRAAGPDAVPPAEDDRD